MSLELEATCREHGIATRYRDFWGREHEVPEETLHAVLRAMGVDAAAPAGAVDEADRNARPLVVQAGEAAPHVTLALGASGAAESRLQWHLVEESGARHSGACAMDGAAGEADAAHGQGAPRTLTCTGMPALPPGYHEVRVCDGAGAVPRARRTVIACPPRCPTVAELARGERVFGPAVQLYALRSRRNWGIGDFTDLASLAAHAAAEGASFVGVNPLHELFLDRPEEPSPYSPSTRRALNPLYLDVTRIEDFAECTAAREQVASPAFQAELARLRAAPLVDYAGVARAKLALLRTLHAHFLAQHAACNTPRAQALRRFATEHDALVADAARFDALQGWLRRDDPAIWGWPAWPPAYRDHEAATVRGFVQQHAAEVDFFLYLQWQADCQLAAAQEAARAAGMVLGLYRDLAVGANPGGAETWQARERFALGAHVGAPPDPFNQKGQDWGLPPWIPDRLALGAYAPWTWLLRANLRHAGALRIDHVMALLRLFWIPAGATPTHGTYVRYPLEDLLAILALESSRHGAAVVGEDLGTVPDEVRTALRERGVHSYRVLYFERMHDGRFAPPDAYPAQALVTVTTHDLPTLAGFWQGTDLAARDALDLFPDPQVREQQHDERRRARPALLHALAQAGLGMAPADDAVPATLDFAQVLAVHRYLARTPAALMSVQLEDVFGAAEQVNLPATTDAQYPNWRRKLAVDLEDYGRDGRFAAVCAAFRGEGRGSRLRGTLKGRG
jgi:(1->4)-alpha-D-glucan 1-alpha-D-glucosylmutase